MKDFVSTIEKLGALLDKHSFDLLFCLLVLSTICFIIMASVLHEVLKSTENNKNNHNHISPGFGYTSRYNKKKGKK